MTHDEAFIQAIREEPASDTPRLIYADWLEEHGDAAGAARAEFIRVQCRLFRLPPTAAEEPALRARAEELLRTHWDAWVGPFRELVGPLRHRYGEGWLGARYQPLGLERFHRGFVDRLGLAAETFLTQADTLARLTPLRHLRLWNGGRCAEELAAAPQLGWLTSLAFVDYHQYPLLAEHARTLALSPYLQRLTELNLHRNSIGDEGLSALAQVPWLAGLESLNLVDNGLSERSVSALTASPNLGRLTALYLGNNHLTDTGAGFASASALGRLSVLSLPNCAIGDAGAEALARWPGLASLLVLELNDNQIGDRGAAALADSPYLGRLEKLGLRNNPISLAGEWALSGSHSLRQAKVALPHNYSTRR